MGYAGIERKRKRRIFHAYSVYSSSSSIQSINDLVALCVCVLSLTHSSSDDYKITQQPPAFSPPVGVGVAVGASAFPACDMDAGTDVVSSRFDLDRRDGFRDGGEDLL